jgi:glycogen operon protein
VTHPPALSGPGLPHPLGVTPAEGGANVAVFSAHADRVLLCLFSPDGARETARIPLPGRTGDIRHGFVAGLAPGALYGLRAEGPWAPEQGHRFNPAKLLLDPYARAWAGRCDPLDRRIRDADPYTQEAVFRAEDSAPAMARCVVTADPPAIDPAERPATPWDRTVICEAHVKSLTRLHQGVPEPLRGTYEALGCDAVIDHLTRMGVTALELLPVQHFLDDLRLLRLGLSNHWGYDTIGFLGPEPRYFGPNGAAGLRAAIRKLHAAGIEVILDVVYNHTAEGDHRGPTLSFRGLDNLSYYRMAEGGRFINDTGCGNTLRAEHPMVMRLILDSLRWWATRMGVDGFRFDLASALAREPHGFDAEGGFLDALRQDPALAPLKLIAEPWDVGPGGYRLGGFPAPFAEWCDRFRDGARRFWRGDARGAHDLAAGLLGSAATFDRPGRAPWASVNFVTAHDGFTLADLTAYARKRNGANGEDNRDGHHENLSDDCGVEGPTDDPAILARRAARRRALLATLFFSQGTPMWLAGDEIGHSQGGNNNAYCQDNAVTWLDWARADHGLAAFVARLAGLRRAHPVLRQPRFLHGAHRPDGRQDAAWRAFDGGPPDWDDPDLRRFALVLRGAAEAPDPAPGAAVVAVNGAAGAATLALPAGAWLRALDSADPEAPGRPAAASESIPGGAVVLFTAADPP